MYDCDDTNSYSLHIIRKAVRSKGNWWVTIALSLALLMACTPYQERATTEDTTVAKSSMSGSTELIVASNVLMDLGYEIDVLSKDKVVTMWQKFYSGKDTRMEKRYYTRVVVLLSSRMVIGQCVSTYTENPFWEKCTNILLLRRMRSNVNKVADRLPIAGNL